MKARKFVIGDQVRLLLDNYTNDNPADVYIISRELPPTANVWQYRVKRVSDGQERAVSELQLAKAGSQTWMNLSAVEAQQDAQRIRNARAPPSAQRHLSRSTGAVHFLKADITLARWAVGEARRLRSARPAPRQNSNDGPQIVASPPG